eukprot:TRINITY_DN40875_c0_g1_i1.p1 TRINITY_DN40875_c0_g1~~TRINITY_DN40875_c0_g1_i1.p1  ORF type:complete len:337 (-),score=15.22 TRINITY_DN40875_c0_g1_i1:64-1074(-)
MWRSMSSSLSGGSSSCRMKPMTGSMYILNAFIVCRILFPGPTGWITPDSLKRLKKLHFADQITDPRILSQAAKLRVFKFESSCAGGLQVNNHAREISQLKAKNIDKYFPFRRYIDHLFIFNLQRAVEQFKSQFPDNVGWLEHGSEPEQLRDGFQSRVIKLLLHKADATPAFRHLRRRLDRWPCHAVLPGHRVALCLQRLEALRRVVHPRVHAAVLRCLFDGCITSHRFQGNGNCIFGCSYPDRLVHYARCPVYHLSCREHLALERPPLQLQVDTFLLLRCSTLSFAAEPGECLARRAISLYALHRLLNASRHSGLLVEHAVDAFDQLTREGYSLHE